MLKVLLWFWALIIIAVIGLVIIAYLNRQYGNPAGIMRAVRSWLTKKGIERDNALTLIGFGFLFWLLLIITHPYR